MLGLLRMLFKEANGLALQDVQVDRRTIALDLVEVEFTGMLVFSSRSRRKIPISLSRPKNFILLNPHLLYSD